MLVDTQMLDTRSLDPDCKQLRFLAWKIGKRVQNLEGAEEQEEAVELRTVQEVSDRRFM